MVSIGVCITLMIVSSVCTLLVTAQLIGGKDNENTSKDR